MNQSRTIRRGFTLIELLIVVGIIIVLVAVLALAIIPWLSKADTNATKSIMDNVGTLLEAQRNTLSVSQMQRDAGPFSGQISHDAKIASSQLLVFYFAPSQKVRESAPVYRGGVGVGSSVDAKDWAKFLMNESGAEDMPYLVDSWGTTYWYTFEKASGKTILRSAGEDLKWDTDDDLAHVSGGGKTGLWSDKRRQ